MHFGFKFWLQIGEKDHTVKQNIINILYRKQKETLKKVHKKLMNRCIQAQPYHEYSIHFGIYNFFYYIFLFAFVLFYQSSFPPLFSVCKSVHRRWMKSDKS